MQPYQLLEREFGELLGPEWYCVAVSSGTSALHLALEVLKTARNVQDRCGVLLPDLTMVACARAVTMANLVPHFADCNEQLLIDPGTWKSLKTYSGPICGIMPVHIYGRRCDMDLIHSVASAHGSFVVEDLAEAHGVPPHPKTDAACWSFYQNKIIRGEEGGMIAFRNPDQAKLARQLRSLGFTEDHDFQHIPRGVNARMSNLHAGPIRRSLRNFRANVAHRKYLVECYDSVIPEVWRMPKRDANWVYDLRIPRLTTPVQDQIVSKLKCSGIQARHCFKPMTTIQEYRNPATFHPNAVRLSQEVIYLPLRESMTKKNCVDYASEFVSTCRGYGVHPELS